MALHPLNFLRNFKNCSRKSYISWLRGQKDLRNYSSIHKLTDSYYQTPSLIPLIGKTLVCATNELVEKYANKLAITVSYQNIKKTFQELHEESDNLALSLLDLGLEKGDHLGICAPNCYEWVVTEYAAVKSGIVLVPINAAYQATELEYCIKKTKCKAMIIAHKFLTQNYYEMLCKITGNLHNSKVGQLKCERTPDLNTVILISPEKLPGTLSFQELMKKSNHGNNRTLKEIQKQIQFDDPAFILFTSGTTGRSKAAEISHHSIINNMYFFGEPLNLSPETSVCTPVPLFHIFGCFASVFTPLFFGSSVVFPAPRFDPAQMIKSINEEKCTVLFGTPTMISDVLTHPNMTKEAFSSITTSVTGAAPVPEKTLKLMYTYIPRITVAYGSTETLCTFQTIQSDPLEKVLTTVGRPLPHTEVKIVDLSGNILPINEEGEIWTRNYGTMLGYYDDPSKTKEAITEAKWYKTGDVGSLDEEGYLMIKSRIKDMIIRGGMNVYPAEVEQFLHTHPCISDVQVCGIPDERLGEDVCAWIKITPGKTLTEQEVKDFCIGQIAHFKIPRRVLFVTQFPMNPTGKVQKYIMKEKSIDMLNLKVDQK